MKPFYKIGGYSLALLSAVLLAACASKQDEGNGDTTAFNLRAIDGYIARAVVFNDTNKNGKLDVWEEKARTDANGFVSYNSTTGKNYCATTATSAELEHCLKLVAGQTEVTLRVVDGYDSITTQQFKGMLSVKASPTAGSGVTVLNATPLTALAEHMTSAQLSKFAQDEGLTDSTIFTTDYTEYGGGNSTADQFKATKIALSAHKVADVLSAGLAERYDLANSDVLPEDISFMVYEVLVSELMNLPNTSLMTYFLTSGNLGTVISKLETAIAAKNIAVKVGTTVNASDIQNQAYEVALAVPAIFGAGPNILPATLKGDIREVEVVTAVARNFDYSTVNAAARLSKIQTISGEAVLAAFKTGMELEATADVGNIVSLVNNNTYQINPNTASNFATKRALSELTVPTGSFDGQTLTMAGSGTNSAVLNFLGTGITAGATGTVTTQMVMDGNNMDLPGTWEIIDDYTMVITLNIAPGINETAVLKPIEKGAGVVAYKFDYNNDQSEWTPNNGTGFAATP